jgi:hypothetical protein
MLRLWIPACLAVCLACGTASAQLYPPTGGDPYAPPGMTPYSGDAEALVASWYNQFLHRQMDVGAATWANYLRRGWSPDQVLAIIVGSREYYRLAGGTPPAFITALYQDLTGSPPLPEQLAYWLGQIRFQTRRDVAHQLLMFYPQSWQTPAPAPYYSYRPSLHNPHYPYYSR